MCRISIIKNQLLQSCTYIIENDDLWLIDCGDYQQIAYYINQSEREFKGIFLTHCHQDHIYGLCELMKQFPTTKIFCSTLTVQGLNDDKMNLSYIITEYPFYFDNNENVVVLNEGKHVIDGLEIEVISTPGHSDDCLAYIIGNNIFTGDSYIPFEKVFTKWPRSNKELAIENEHRLKQLIEGRNLNVYPGHWQ